MGRETRPEQLRIRPRARKRRRLGHRSQSEPALRRRGAREKARHCGGERLAGEKDEIEPKLSSGGAQAGLVALVHHAKKTPDALEILTIGKRAPHDVNNGLARASLAAAKPNGDHSGHGFSHLH